MQNVFDAVLGTHFARAERNARTEDHARLEARHTDAARTDSAASTLYQREMEDDPAAEYLFGGYFNTGDMQPEEHEMLNAALRAGDERSDATAFAILRKYVRRHARDVAEYKANGKPA